MGKLKKQTLALVFYFFIMYNKNKRFVQEVCTMQLQDRGTKKWVSLMLPEHVEMLKEVFIEYKEKPQLDGQEKEMIDQTLKWALETKEEIEITYFDDGFYKKYRGKLQRIDQWRGYIILFQAGGVRISLQDIISIEKLMQH